VVQQSRRPLAGQQHPWGLWCSSDQLQPQLTQWHRLQPRPLRRLVWREQLLQAEGAHNGATP
jgi:hypothetical protein